MVYKSDCKSGEDEFTNESKNHDVEAFILSVTLSCTLDESYSASTKVLPNFFIYVVASNTTIPFEKFFHGSYSLRTFFTPA